MELDLHSPTNEKTYEIFTLCILSRRSRFRAGTRYKRRGVDETGEVANYVETEQLIAYQTHEVSFVQIRGSVPVYWSQPGYKYRPPPRIDKGKIEVTFIAFILTFNSIFQAKRIRKLHLKSTTTKKYKNTAPYVPLILSIKRERKKLYSMHTRIMFSCTIALLLRTPRSISTNIGACTL